MSSVVRSVLGAALLLTSASAMMAASGTPAAAQSAQTGASTATAAAPVANQTVQTGASTAPAASNNAPTAAQPKKPQRAGIADNSDPYGGNDPNSTAGARAFFTPQY